MTSPVFLFHFFLILCALKYAWKRNLESKKKNHSGMFVFLFCAARIASWTSLLLFLLYYFYSNLTIYHFCVVLNFSFTCVIILYVYNSNFILLFPYTNRCWRFWARSLMTFYRPAGRFRPSFWVRRFSPASCSWPCWFLSTPSSTAGWSTRWSRLRAAMTGIIAIISSVRPWRPNRLPWNRTWLPWKSVRLYRLITLALALNRHCYTIPP